MIDETSGRRYDGDAYRYDPDSHPELSTAVLFAVADALDSDVEDLPALRDVLDPDALDALADSSSELRLEFEYADCLVTVCPADSVLVAPLADADK
ncbi:MAG: HalOD1 output domain-containing protein [Halobacteriaceae archaeon]